MIDPLNDPAPRWSHRSVLTLVGYAALGAGAFLMLKAEDGSLRTAMENGQKAQAMIDGRQDERLAEAEHATDEINDKLDAICERLRCRAEGITK